MKFFNKFPFTRKLQKWGMKNITNTMLISNIYLSNQEPIKVQIQEQHWGLQSIADSFPGSLLYFPPSCGDYFVTTESSRIGKSKLSFPDFFPNKVTWDGATLNYLVFYKEIHT